MLFRNNYAIVLENSLSLLLILLYFQVDRDWSLLHQSRSSTSNCNKPFGAHVPFNTFTPKDSYSSNF